MKVYDCPDWFDSDHHIAGLDELIVNAPGISVTEEGACAQARGLECRHKRGRAESGSWNPTARTA